jgi:hypothetical protein
MMQKKSWQQSSLEPSAEADSIKLSAAELALIRNIADKVEADDFRNENTHVFALHNTLVRHYGADWIQWLPETLWRQLTVDHFIDSPDSLPRILKDKILALQVTHATNRPWVEFEVFENVSTAFDGDVPSPLVLEPRTAEECLFTMHCLKTIRPDEEFAPEVLIYVASCFANDNIVHVGPARCLEGVQAYLDTFIHDHALSERAGKVFSSLWAQRNMVSVAQLADAEDDPLKVQLRKLYGVYTYWENHYGLDTRPA